jgi:predicted small lipoprotein YifL
MPIEIGKFMRCKGLRRGALLRAAARGRSTSALLAFMIVAVALSLSACGKKGPPEPPDPQSDHFPRQYPDPSTL